jgi:hypothetical protein
MTMAYVDPRSLDSSALHGLGRFAAKTLPPKKVYSGPVVAGRLSRKSNIRNIRNEAVWPGMPYYTGPNDRGLRGFNIGKFFSNAIGDIVDFAGPLLGGVLGGSVLGGVVSGAGQSSTQTTAQTTSIQSTQETWNMIDRILATAKGMNTGNTPLPTPAPAPASPLSGNTGLLIAGAVGVGALFLLSRR